MTVKFDHERCDLNPFCPVAKVCPTSAMFVDRKTYKPTFDASKCEGCGICLSSCPHGAVFEE